MDWALGDRHPDVGCCYVGRNRTAQPNRRIVSSKLIYNWRIYDCEMGQEKQVVEDVSELTA